MTDFKINDSKNLVLIHDGATSSQACKLCIFDSASTDRCPTDTDDILICVEAPGYGYYKNNLIETLKNL